jgi:hypothetical protein
MPELIEKQKKSPVFGILFLFFKKLIDYGKGYLYD